MKKRVAILFPSSTKGGVYQYALSIADSLLREPDNFEYIVIYEREKPELSFNDCPDRVEFIQVPAFHPGPLRKILHLAGLYFGLRFLTIKVLQKLLDRIRIDLLIVPTPLFFSVPLDVPFVTSLPDHNDKYFPDFPEYSLKTRIARDIIFRFYGKQALMVVADSATTVGDLEKYSGVPKEKSCIIPYIPPSYTIQNRNMSPDQVRQLTEKYDLPGKFIFYPAQYWYQKNHLRLIKSIHIVKEKFNESVFLVLTGNTQGNRIYESVARDLNREIKNLGLEKQIFQLGYTGNAEIIALYKRAVALVSPALQVPTTIPPLEAMMLGTPVVTVNLPEIPEQVGGAGLFFDPLDVDDMAEKIYRVWTDEALRRKMIQDGLKQVAAMTLENYGRKWRTVIADTICQCSSGNPGN